MKKVMVTVGTGSFEELVEIASRWGDSVFIQYGAGRKPENRYCVDYLDNIEAALKKSDVIITHAGAGTIYKLLEFGRKFVVVPNEARNDDHQLEIARYLENEGFALVLHTNTLKSMSLKDVLSLVENFTPVEYRYTKFDMVGFVNSFEKR